MTFYVLSLVAHATATCQLSVSATALRSNGFCVVLMAFRILRADKQNQLLNSGLPSYMPIVRIVIESGIMNTAYLLSVIITFATGSNAVEILADMVSRICGEKFLLTGSGHLGCSCGRHYIHYYDYTCSYEFSASMDGSDSQ